jgi:hypothetical protein
MIAIRRVARLELHVEAPSWAHLFHRVEMNRRRDRSNGSRVEQAAVMMARHRRAAAIRADAERHWNGLPVR